MRVTILLSIVRLKVHLFRYSQTSYKVCSGKSLEIMDSQQGSGIAVEKVGTNYYDLNDIIACNSSVSCSFGRTNPKGLRCFCTFFFQFD